jgi:hypothetical protein
MRKPLVIAVALAIASMLGPRLGSGLGAFAAAPAYAAPDAQSADQYQNDSYYEPYTAEQLDNLLAPVALYPDPLLAQVLVAATFPDQIQDAAEFVRRNGPNDDAIADQGWDVSVKAVAHYPTVLYMMNDKLDWTTAVGQAYVNQSTDTMSSVQHLRSMANAEGNLVSTPQQQVIVDRGYIQIVPAEPRLIYVPTYDPGVIYSRRVYGPSGFGSYFSFGSGFAIGAWLNYDLDWGTRRVIYDGWNGGGWRARSRPYVRINNVYVNNNYRSVPINRAVVNRPVNYANVNRFNSVHRNVTYDNRARINARGNERGPQVDRNVNRNTNNDLDRRRQGEIPPTTTRPAAPPRTTDRGFRQNDGVNRGQQNRTAPAPAQPPVTQRPNGENDRNGNTGFRGRQNQPAPAPAQPPVTQRPNDGGGRNGNAEFRGRGRQNQPAPAPAQPPVSQQPNYREGRQNRGQASPTPPAAQPNAGAGQANRPGGEASRGERPSRTQGNQGNQGDRGGDRGNRGNRGNERSE